MIHLLASVFFTTSCNVYYNSATPVYTNVPCQAQFHNRKLSRVNVWLPNARRYYDWKVGQPQVTADPRWNECLRYTRKEGNQYQICTVKPL